MPEVRSENKGNGKDEDVSTSVFQSFLLGEALPVVPEKLVKRILEPVFVDMAELLKDNMEVERQRSSLEGSSSSVLQSRLSRREVPDALSWLQSSARDTV